MCNLQQSLCHLVELAAVHHQSVNDQEQFVVVAQLFDDSFVVVTNLMSTILIASEELRAMS